MNWRMEREMMNKKLIEEADRISRIEKENALKDICLNCTNPKCTGYCDKFPSKREKEKRRQKRTRAEPKKIAPIKCKRIIQRRDRKI